MKKESVLLYLISNKVMMRKFVSLSTLIFLLHHSSVSVQFTSGQIPKHGANFNISQFPNNLTQFPPHVISPLQPYLTINHSYISTWHMTLLKLPLDAALLRVKYKFGTRFKRIFVRFLLDGGVDKSSKPYY